MPHPNKPPPTKTQTPAPPTCSKPHRAPLILHPEKVSAPPREVAPAAAILNTGEPEGALG